MSNMKCPFCQQELVQEGSDNYWCKKCNLEKYRPALYGSQKLWQELIYTRKALEHSEICCTEWEKQALDYKAENIALLGKLDLAVNVLKGIDELLSSNKFDVKELPLLNITQTKISMLLKYINIEQITALEQKDVK